MVARKSRPEVQSDQVFLNVPYNRSYEKMLVALTCALVVVGCVPRLTFEVPEVGEGRLKRIFDLIKSCRVSVHDLSAVGLPVRFNMPFELGLAWTVKQQLGEHDFLILERKAHRLPRHLSDLNGIDPKIHGGTAAGAIGAILDTLVRPDGNPASEDVMRLHRQMMKVVPELKKRHRTKDLFGARIYGELVVAANITAADMDLI